VVGRRGRVGGTGGIHIRCCILDDDWISGKRLPPSPSATEERRFSAGTGGRRVGRQRAGDDGAHADKAIMSLICVRDSRRAWCRYLLNGVGGFCDGLWKRPEAGRRSAKTCAEGGGGKLEGRCREAAVRSVG